MPQPRDIGTENNRVLVRGALELHNYHRLLAALYNVVVKEGHNNVLLDFSECTASSSGPMLSLIAEVHRLRGEQKGLVFELRPPEDRTLVNLFRNTNWAHELDADHPESIYRGHPNVPVIHYTDPVGQQQAVKNMLDAIMRSMPISARSELSAMEWALGETTDNVLQHSQSETGGFVQLTSFSQQRIEYAVADTGIGIPDSLRASEGMALSDADALEKAIREGITRDPNVGAGNGLFGSYQISFACKSNFCIHSGFGRLLYTLNDGLSIHKDYIPHRGTLIVGQIDLSAPGVLAKALRFDGKQYEPAVDSFELHYEEKDSDDSVIRVGEEHGSLSSRAAAKVFRIKIENMLRLSRNKRIVVNFTDVPVVSSSFADEVFGRLFTTLGPVRFMQSIRLRAMNPTVQGLIDRAIEQRMHLSAK